MTDSGRPIFDQFSLRIRLVTVIGTESNVSVGRLRDFSKFHVHVILVKGQGWALTVRDTNLGEP